MRQNTDGLDTGCRFFRCDAALSVRIYAYEFTGCTGSLIDIETDTVFNKIIEGQLLLCKLIRVAGIDLLSVDDDVFTEIYAHTYQAVSVPEINVGFISISNFLCSRSMTICAVDLASGSHKHAPNVVRIDMRIDFRMIYIAALNDLVVADGKFNS